MLKSWITRNKNFTIEVRILINKWFFRLHLHVTSLESHLFNAMHIWRRFWWIVLLFSSTFKWVMWRWAKFPSIWQKVTSWVLTDDQLIVVVYSLFWTSCTSRGRERSWRRSKSHIIFDIESYWVIVFERSFWHCRFSRFDKTSAHFDQSQ